MTHVAKIVTLKFDAAALDALAATLTKGAPKGAQAWPVIAAVASSIYAHGARREQFFPGSVKGRTPHPAFVALHEGSTLTARAFRALLGEYGQRIAASGRELTQQAHDALISDMQAFFMDACAPAPKAPAAPAESALDKALRLVWENAAGLSAAQGGILADIVQRATASMGTLPAPTAPAPAPAPKPAKGKAKPETA